MQKSRDPWWFFLFLLCVSCLGWLTNAFAPSLAPATAGFFVLLFVMTYSLSYFLAMHARWSVLLSVGVVVFFLLRYANLRHPLYPLLLIASLVSLEVFFQRR